MSSALGINFRIPGVDDGDDRLADEILLRITHLHGARSVAGRAHILHAKPAVAAEVFRFFGCHDEFLKKLLSRFARRTLLQSVPIARSYL